MSNINYAKTAQRHGFHLVDPSPWPFVTATAVLSMALGGVAYMHGYSGGGFTLFVAFIATLLSTGVWWGGN